LSLARAISSGRKPYLLKLKTIAYFGVALEITTLILSSVGIFTGKVSVDNVLGFCHSI
jgi:hypothetical protein